MKRQAFYSILIDNQQNQKTSAGPKKRIIEDGQKCRILNKSAPGEMRYRRPFPLSPSQHSGMHACMRSCFFACTDGHNTSTPDVGI